MLLRDIALEIARNIRGVNDYLTFTAVSRAMRELIYDKRLTSQLCIVVKHYTTWSKEMHNFAEKCGFYIVFNSAFMIELDVYCGSKLTAHHNVICSSCYVLYKFTKNRLFAELCYFRCYATPRRIVSCGKCFKFVCKEDNVPYDFVSDVCACLDCGPPDKLCPKCNVFPLTDRYKFTPQHDDICVMCDYDRYVELNGEYAWMKRCREIML